MEQKKKAPPSSSSTTSSSSSPDFPFYRATSDYKDASPGMMSLTKGDLVEVIRKENQGLWLVKLNGLTGWTPSRVLEQIEASMINLLSASLKNVNVDPSTLKAFHKALNSDDDDFSVGFSVSVGSGEKLKTTLESFTNDGKASTSTSNKDKNTRTSAYTLSAETLLPFLSSFSAAVSNLTSAAKANATSTSSSAQKNSSERMRLLARIFSQLAFLDSGFKENLDFKAKMNKMKDSLEEERKYLIELRKSHVGLENGKGKALDIDQTIVERLKPLSSKLDLLMKEMGETEPKIGVVSGLAAEIFPEILVNSKESGMGDSGKVLLTRSIQMLDRYLHTSPPVALREDIKPAPQDSIGSQVSTREEHPPEVKAQVVPKLVDSPPSSKQDQTVPTSEVKVVDGKSKSTRFSKLSAIPKFFTSSTSKTPASASTSTSSSHSLAESGLHSLPKSSTPTDPLLEPASAKDLSPSALEINSSAKNELNSPASEEIKTDSFDFGAPESDEIPASIIPASFSFEEIGIDKMVTTGEIETSHACISSLISPALQADSGQRGRGTFKSRLESMIVRDEKLSSKLNAKEAAALNLSPSKSQEIMDNHLFCQVTNLVNQMRDESDVDLKLDLSEEEKNCTFCFEAVELITMSYLAALSTSWSEEIETQVLQVEGALMSEMALGGSEDEKRFLKASPNPSSKAGSPQATVYPLASNRLQGLSVVAWLDFEGRSEGQGCFNRGQVATIIPFEINSVVIYDPFSLGQVGRDGWIRVILGAEGSQDTTVSLDMKEEDGSVSSWQAKSVLVPAQFFIAEVRAKCYLRSALLKATSNERTTTSFQIKALNMPSSRIVDLTSSHDCSVVTADWISRKAIPRVGSKISPPKKALPAPAPASTDSTAPASQAPTTPSKTSASAATSPQVTSPNTSITSPKPTKTTEKETAPKTSKPKPHPKKGHFKKTARHSARKENRQKEKNLKKETVAKIKLEEKNSIEKATLVNASSLVSIFNSRMNVKECLKWLEKVKKASLWDEKSENYSLILGAIESTHSKEIAPSEMMDKVRDLVNPASHKELIDEMIPLLSVPSTLPSTPKMTSAEEAIFFRSAKEDAQSSEQCSQGPSQILSIEPKVSVDAEEEEEAFHQEQEQEDVNEPGRASPKTKEQRREKFNALRKAGRPVSSQLTEEFGEDLVSPIRLFRNESTAALSESMSRSTSAITHATQETSFASHQDASTEVSGASSDSEAEVWDLIDGKPFEGEAFTTFCKEMNADSASALLLLKFSVGKPNYDLAKEIQQEVETSVQWPLNSEFSASTLIPGGWKSMWALEIQQVLLLESFTSSRGLAMTLQNGRRILLNKIKEHNSVLSTLSDCFKDLQLNQATPILIYHSALRLAGSLVEIGNSTVEYEFEVEGDRDRFRSILRLQFGLRILNLLMNSLQEKGTIGRNSGEAEDWSEDSSTAAWASLGGLPRQEPLKSDSNGQVYSGFESVQGEFLSSLTFEPFTLSNADLEDLKKESHLEGGWGVIDDQEGKEEAGNTKESFGSLTPNENDQNEAGNETEAASTSNVQTTPKPVNRQIHARPRQKGLHKKSSKCRKILL